MGKFKEIDIMLKSIDYKTIFIVVILIIASITIFSMKNVIKKCENKIRNANENVEYWIQQYKIIEKERDEILRTNEELNYQLGTFQRKINNIDTKEDE